MGKIFIKKKLSLLYMRYIFKNYLSVLIMVFSFDDRGDIHEQDCKVSNLNM